MTVTAGLRNGLDDLEPLRWQQADLAGRLLARAFHHYPAISFLFPDERRRALVTPHIWSEACRYSMHYGEVSVARDFSGIACWLPPGATNKTLWRELRAGMGSLLYHLRPREMIAIIRNDRYADALSARCAPGAHWYLFVIGVEPECQGQGIGAALLSPVLARADREGRPVYLETHAPRNVGFYQHHGFAVAGQGHMPGSDVPVYAMLRQPRPSD